MTAIAKARLASTMGPPLPAMGTLPSAANSLFYAFTLVVQDAAGRAAVPVDGGGLNAFGIADATYDNRTGSEAGGGAGDLDVHVTWGVVRLKYVGTTPVHRSRMFVVDNQTVSADRQSATGAMRGFAGIAIEVDTATSSVFVFVNPINGALNLPFVATLPAFAAADSAPTSIAHEAHYDIPTTAANSTISLPAATSYPDGLTAYFHADGIKNGHTLTFRDVATAISAATIASKRILAIASVMGGKWAVTLTVGP